MVSFLFGCVEVIDEFLDIGRFSPNRSVLAKVASMFLKH